MSDRDARTIGEEIDVLAHLTGAPEAFVRQVRALFTSKAIALDEDAAPFRPALEEAFRREEMIRTYSDHVQRGLSRIRDNLVRVKSTCRGDADRVRDARGSLERSVRRLRESGERLEAAAYAFGSRSRVVKEVEAEPLVPGPKEVQ